MGEYSKYTVTDLTDMTITDDEESLNSIATGWANTGAVLGTAKDALKERLESLRAVWTSPSFAVFEEFINRTAANVEAAQTQADNRADAAGKIATTAGWAKDRVAEQFTQYLQAKLKTVQSPDSSTLGGITSIAGVIPGALTEGTTPTDEQIRAPYDKQAHKIMKIALEDYEQNKPAMVQDVIRVQPIKPPEDYWSDGQDSWPGDGGSGSNASDMAGLSAVSYGGNTVGAGIEPSLQSVGHGHAASVTPAHIGGAPPSSGLPNTPVGGFPPGTIGPNKPPTAPPKLPGSPANQARNTLAPRGSQAASRTPGLPTRANSQVRSGIPTNRSTNRWAGRGLQKSQMAPVNRVGEPRKSGEVLGRRSAATKPVTSGSANAKTASRSVRPSVVKGADKSAKLQSRGKAPMDNTKRGFTSRVINPRNRFADGHSRTPYVGTKLNTTAKPEPFGKRPEPETSRKKLRREIDAARAARRKKLTQTSGLSRPVIDNGVTSPAQLDRAIPTPREAVKAEDGFWQPPGGLVRGVIGKRDWDPDAIEHDPGPIFSPRSVQVEELDARLGHLHEPGPTAFDPKRRSMNPWPQE